MTSILPDQVHVDAALTTFAQEYASQQDQFIASLVAPVIPVAKRSDYYWVHGTEGFQIPVADRAPGARYGEVSWSKSTGSYACKGYGLTASVPKEVMANADPAVDPAQDAVTIPVDQLMLAYEKRVADKLFNSSVFDQTAALTGADRWDDDDSEPWTHVATAKANVRGKIGREPNIMVVGYSVFNALQAHPGIRKIVFGLNAPESMPTEAQIAEALGLDRLVVGRAVSSAAANTFTDVWGRYASIAYVDPSPSSRSIAPLKTFAWNVDGGRFATRGPVWDDDTKSWKWYVDDYTDERLISKYAAYLYSTVVS